MEVVFIYMFWYAWKKLPAKAHIVVGILAVTGAWFSAAMITSVNSYMQAPPGVITAYDVDHGVWKYDEGYPKLTLFVPDKIATFLDVEKLKSLGMDVLGEKDDSVIVAMPVAIVRELMSDAFSGKTVENSVLYSVLKEDAKEELKNERVFDVVDAIVSKTVQEVGVYTVTFKSPVYVASLTHTLFASITVSAFTVAGGYALSYRRRKDERAKIGLKFGIYAALVAIAIQGLVTGHEMGVAIAEWNPEKFAAIESGTPDFLKSVVAFLAYGDFGKSIPDYSQIPADFRPPTLIHDLYYLKMSLAALLLLSALFLAIRLYKDADIPYGYVAILPVVAQVVSFLGWAVREIGRKPWTIYGVMDVQTAHTINPPSGVEAGAIAVYLAAILAILIFATYRFLWRGDAA